MLKRKALKRTTIKIKWRGRKIHSWSWLLCLFVFLIYIFLLHVFAFYLRLVSRSLAHCLVTVWGEPYIFTRLYLVWGSMNPYVLFIFPEEEFIAMQCSWLLTCRLAGYTIVHVTYLVFACGRIPLGGWYMCSFWFKHIQLIVTWRKSIWLPRKLAQSQ